MESELFKSKYRIKSTRLPGYDYSNDGLYFVTICTYEQELFFGDVIDKKMILNELGKMAKKYWRELPRHFDNLRLDEFIIMPNHVHGILVIDNAMNAGNTTRIRVHVRRDAINRVSTDVARFANTDSGKIGGITGKYNPMGKKTIGEMIRWYKGRCKFEINRRGAVDCNFSVFTWQTRFYDHIIRDEKTLNKIRQYIVENPKKWEQDRNNVEDYVELNNSETINNKF